MIVRNETAIEVPGLGTVYFEPLTRAPRLSGAAANRTHSQRFRFESNGREYWGEVIRLFDRDGRQGERVSCDVDLMTRNNATGYGRQLPETAKRDWRFELRQAFKRNLEAFLAAEESAAPAGDVALADAAGETAEPDPVSANLPDMSEFTAPADPMDSISDVETVRQAGTIDLTPTWRGILPALLAAMTDGTAEGRRIAREELTRMAALADERNELAARRVAADPDPDAVAIGPDPDAAGALLVTGNGWRIQVYPERVADGANAKHYLSGHRDGCRDVFESRLTLAKAIGDAVSLAARDGRWPESCYQGTPETISN